VVPFPCKDRHPGTEANSRSGLRPPGILTRSRHPVRPPIAEATRPGRDRFHIGGPRCPLHQLIGPCVWRYGFIMMNSGPRYLARYHLRPSFAAKGCTMQSHPGAGWRQGPTGQSSALYIGSRAPLGGDGLGASAGFGRRPSRSGTHASSRQSDPRREAAAVLVG